MTRMSRNAQRRTSAWTLIVLAALLTAVSIVGARLAAASAPTLFVTNANGNKVTEYPAGTFGNLVPATAVGGAATGLGSRCAIAVGSAGNVYVANFANGQGVSGSITIYPPAASGNASPSAIIVGTAT